MSRKHIVVGTPADLGHRLNLLDSGEVRKIVESYGLDALDRRGEKGGRARRDPRRFLASVSATAVEMFPAVGLGEDLRLARRGPRVRRWRWTSDWCTC